MFGFQRSVTNITERVGQSTFKETKKVNKEFKRGASTLEEYFSERTRDFRIADVYFSFKNREVLSLLAERGEAILEDNKELKTTIEKEIMEAIHKKHDDYITPVVAFITFGNEESYLKATELNKVRVGSKEYYKKYWQGHPLYFKPALEPSSILWENQYVPNIEKYFKMFLSLIVVGVVLFISFILLFYAQKEIYDYLNVYPYMDCDAIYDTYGDSLERYAVLEWTYLHNKLQTNDLTSSTGTLSCFCKKHSNEHGVFSTLSTKHYTPVLNGTEFVGGQICYQWQSGNTLISSLDIIITGVIVIADIILGSIVVWMIKWVHYRSINIEYAIIQAIIFVSQYLNNGLSLILVGISVDQFIGYHIPLLDGKYPDFTARWFYEISSFFITPMIINIFIPIAEFAIVYSMYSIRRCHDRKWTRDPYATRCKSMGQYIEKMSGSENDIFSGYSFIMVVVFINMCFGVGLPILFPLTLIALLIVYFFERVLTVYWYKKSAMLNDRLNKSAIKTLKWAVHCYTFTGYWFLTNRQIFYDDVHPMSRRSDLETTNHSIYNIEIDRTFPLLVFSFCLLAYMIFYNIFAFVWSLIKTDTMNIYLRSVEGLYTYYDSLDHHDIKAIVLEEDNTRVNFNYSKMNDRTFKQFKNSRLKRKHSLKMLTKAETAILKDKTIFNTPCYDILSNNRYIDMYQYVPVIYRDINMSFNDSDFARKVVDLAYWYQFEPKMLEEHKVDPRFTVYRRMDYYVKNMSTLSRKDTYSRKSTGKQSYLGSN